MVKYSSNKSHLAIYLEQYPWKKALAWLCFLAPFFFIAYGFSNHYTASRTDISVCVFEWEKYIPFLPWTILPYWSIDLFYGLSLFLCKTSQELRMHALRLSLATIVCVTGFLVFPLRMTFPHPATTGFWGWLFQKLTDFDLPYNQAPSLHICLLIILWDLFIKHTNARFKILVHCWALLIGISVLTTYQHHSIDILTGVFAGFVCCFAIPEINWKKWHSGQPLKAKKLAWYYLSGAVIFCCIAMIIKNWAWLLLWPAFALFCISLGYFKLGPAIMQKDTKTGNLSLYAHWLLAPYRIIAILTRYYFLSKLSPAAEIIPNLWLGGYPSLLPIKNCAVLDLCAEYPKAACVSSSVSYMSVPMLDLLVPSKEELKLALLPLLHLHNKGPVLVHCALGLTRSAAVIASYLVVEKQMTLASALELLEKKRPGIALSPTARETIADLTNTMMNQKANSWKSS